MPALKGEESCTKRGARCAVIALVRKSSTLVVTQKGQARVALIDTAIEDGGTLALSGIVPLRAVVSCDNGPSDVLISTDKAF